MSSNHVENGAGVTVLPRPRHDLTFTFPDSGQTVRVRRLGPFVMDDLREAVLAAMPAPVAPLVRVEDGEDAQGHPTYRTERNPADPSYQAAMTAHQQQVVEETARRLIALLTTFCAEPLSPEDLDRDEIAVQRAIRQATGATGTEAMSDQEIWLRYLCIRTPRDLAAFQSFVLSRSQPTEEVVQAHISTFRGDVPREADL